MRCVTTEIELTGWRIGQYNNYSFNSMAKFGDIYLGASRAGLSTLGGEQDNGMGIQSGFFIPLSDFGVQHNKSIFAVYLGVESEGDLILTVSVDEVDPVEIEVPVSTSGFQRKRIRVPGTLVGRYWSLGVSNPGGSYFSVESIDALVKIMHSSHV